MSPSQRTTVEAPPKPFVDRRVRTRPLHNESPERADTTMSLSHEDPADCLVPSQRDTTVCGPLSPNLTVNPPWYLPGEDWTGSRQLGCSRQWSQIEKERWRSQSRSPSRPQLNPNNAIPSLFRAASQQRVLRLIDTSKSDKSGTK